MRRLSFLIFLLPIFFAFIPVRVLKIECGNSTTCISLGKVEIEVVYTHSVSRTEVRDFYVINGSGIYAVKQMWQQFDAGQGVEYDGIENGYFVKNLSLKLGRILEYGFVPLNNATVRFDDKILKVSNRLRFTVKTVPLVDLLRSYLLGGGLNGG